MDYSNPRTDSKVRPVHDSVQVLKDMWSLRARLEVASGFRRSGHCSGRTLCRWEAYADRVNHRAAPADPAEMARRVADDQLDRGNMVRNGPRHADHRPRSQRDAADDRRVSRQPLRRAEGTST